MAITATGSNKVFKPVPEGSHMAVCYRVVDIGTQRWEYQGEPQIGRKVLIFWELHGEDETGQPLQTDDGQPLSVSKKYTLSLGKKAALRADLESWRGRAFTEEEMGGFVIDNLVKQPCMITIKQERKGEKTFSKVASVTRFPAALKEHRPMPINDCKVFDLSEPDQLVFDTLPEWVQKLINESAERSGPPPGQKQAGARESRQATAFDDMEDDIPF